MSRKDQTRMLVGVRPQPGNDGRLRLRSAQKRGYERLPMWAKAKRDHHDVVRAQGTS
jgi:hypothetical protein